MRRLNPSVPPAPRFLAIILGLLTSWPCAAFAQTFQVNDTEFLDATWSHELRPDSLAGSQTITRQVTVDNPTGYQQGDCTWGKGTLRTSHVDIASLYDPARTGPVSGVDVQFTFRMLAGSSGAQNTQAGILLRQAGQTYVYSAMGTWTIGTNWVLLSLPNLTAQDFGLVGPGGPNFNVHPDFTCTGAPIAFGYTVCNSSSRSNNSVTWNIDAYVATVHYTTSGDCNGNGVDDGCELATGLADDCESNGVPDDCQADTDHDGLIDCCDPDVPDGDGDGVRDPCDNCPLIPNPAQEEACDLPANVICVRPGAIGNQDGTDWYNAFTDLQSALTRAANSGGAINEIWVAEATYKPTTGLDRNVSFIPGSSVSIYGGFAANETQRGQRDPQQHVTTLSGDLSGDDIPNLSDGLLCYSGNGNPHDSGCAAFDLDADGDVDEVDLHIDDNSGHVVQITTNALIDGFTITGGNAAVSGGGGLWSSSSTGAIIRNCQFAANHSSSTGGAINIFGNGVIDSCAITGNRAGSGGGMYCSTSVTVTGTRVAHNRAAYSGGGCLFSSWSGTMTGCTLEENRAGYGGGISVSAGNPTFNNCSFLRNRAEGPSNPASGGAAYLYLSAGATAKFTGCQFLGNSAPGGGGGAVYAWYNLVSANWNLNLVNCVFAGNTSAYGYCCSFEKLIVKMANCTLVANGNNDVEEALYLAWTTFTGANLIFSGNPSGASLSPLLNPFHLYQSTATVSYSIMRRVGSPSSHNLNADPLFVRNPSRGADGLWGTADDDYGDLRPSPASPCIDAGANNAAGLLAGTTTDVAGDPRFVEQGAVLNKGNGTKPIIDIGAYEAAGDCNQNGTPDENEPDADNDGAINACDGCSADPAKAQPGQCGCGQPDTDTDHDGIPDCLDVTCRPSGYFLAVNPGFLLQVDAATAAAAPRSGIGMRGYAQIDGADFDPNTARLYCADRHTGLLLAGDISNGQLTPIGPIGFAGVTGLGFDRSTNTLYGTAYGEDFSTDDSVLIRINTQTGVGTSIGSLGNTLVSGLAFDPLLQVLFGVNNQTRSLCRINTSTGAVTDFGNAITQYSIYSLAFDETGNRLLTFDAATDQLIALDPATAAKTVLGGAYISDLTGAGVNPADGMLYGFEVNGPELIKIDPTTRTVTPLSTPGSRNMDGLAYDPATGTLYGIDSYSRYVYRVDPRTGLSTAVRKFSPQMSDMAWDPASGTLLALKGSSQVYRLNLGTGSSTLIASGANYQGLAYDPGSGKVYLTDYTTATLVSLDPVSKVFTTIGALGFSGIANLAFDTGTNTLYGYDDTTDQLVQIDTATGAAAAVRPIIVGGNAMRAMAIDPATRTLFIANTMLFRADLDSAGAWSAGSLGSTTIKDIAYDSASDTLWAVEGNYSYNLLEMRPATGETRFVGPTQEIEDLAFDPHTQTLYGLNPTDSDLMTIDRSTGAATWLMDSGARAIAFDVNRRTLFYLDSLGGVGEIDPATKQTINHCYISSGAGQLYSLTANANDGLLYAVDRRTTSLVSIDPDTCAVTAIGNTNYASVEGLEFISPDCNGNGVPDYCDTAGGASPDCDANHVPDECQADSDTDGRIDPCDNCPELANADQSDLDLDAVGDPCDNCPGNANPDQVDIDGDDAGDACDTCASDPLKTAPGVCGCGIPDVDTDEDGLLDCNDNCSAVANSDQLNQDGDAFGDACDACPLQPTTGQEPDGDSDGKPNLCDNCPSTANPDQADRDSDAIGDACDNCPDLPGSDQRDRDRDGIGDLCDDDIDGDGTPNAQDACPLDPHKIADLDTDGDALLDCNDNCPAVPNPNQENVCRPGPGILCVDADASGAGDGSSWFNAYNRLEDALTCAGGAGGTITEIWVAQGMYHPPAANSPYRLVNGVSLYGGFAGSESQRSQRDPASNVTILSGDLLDNDIGGLDDPSRSDNAYPLITTSQGVPVGSSTLSGFTVSSSGPSATQQCLQPALYVLAWNTTVEDCIFRRNVGGAIVAGKQLTVDRCTFEENAGSNGGALYSNSQVPPVLRDCTFSGNTASNAGGAVCWSSGGSMTIRNCSFSRNSARYSGGAMETSGAVDAANCSFDRNTVTFGPGQGGAVRLYSGSSRFANCVFTGNVASGYGGALSLQYYGSATLVNCLFSGNSAATAGGAVCGAYYTVNATNCTLVANDADSGGGIAQVAFLTLTNCIVWGNVSRSVPGQQIAPGNYTTTISYCCVQGGWTGGTNISTLDPLVVRAPSRGPDGNWDGVNDDYGDLHLQPGSPALDAGNNSAVPADTLDIDGDSNASEPTPLDIDLHPRFQNTPQPDTGSGTPPLVDLGAFEAGGDCNGNGIPDAQETDSDSDGWIDACDNCPAQQNADQHDSDGDGAGDACDTCPATVPGAVVDAAGCPPVIPGDFNRDGDVDSSDLEAFSPCTSGPSMPLISGCESKDLDGNGSVDQDDFGILQRCYSSANVAAGPNCAN